MVSWPVMNQGPFDVGKDGCLGQRMEAEEGFGARRVVKYQKGVCWGGQGERRGQRLEIRGGVDRFDILQRVSLK